MLEVSGLSVAYGSVRAVHSLDLSLARGETVALLGANGAGKTSSVEAIAGLLPKAGGRVVFEGEDITGLAASTVVRRGLALVPQWRELFPNFTVEETLRAASSAPRGRAPTPLPEIYELFPVLGERRRQLAGSLSGGEQQMLALGRALVTNPRAILLDEPSAGLAVAIVKTLVGTVRRIAESGVGILLVEQNLEIAESLASRAVVLTTGRVVWEGPMADAMTNPEIREAYFA